MEQHIIYDEYAEKLELMEQNMFNNLQPGIERLGATIVDPERFMHELILTMKPTLVSFLLAASPTLAEETLHMEYLGERFYAFLNVDSCQQIIKHVQLRSCV